MVWLLEFAIQIIAELLGHEMAREGPWWLEIIACLVCLLALGLPILLLALLLG